WNIELRFPGAVGGLCEARAACAALAVEAQYRRTRRSADAYGDADRRRRHNALADQIAQRNWRRIGVLRRRRPGFDRHGLVAEQWAGVGEEAARQTITGMTAGDHKRANQQHQNGVAQLVRVEFVEPRPWRPEAKLVGILK